MTVLATTRFSRVPPIGMSPQKDSSRDDMQSEKREHSANGSANQSRIRSVQSSGRENLRDCAGVTENPGPHYSLNESHLTYAVLVSRSNRMLKHRKEGMAKFEFYLYTRVSPFQIQDMCEGIYRYRKPSPLHGKLSIRLGSIFSDF